MTAARTLHAHLHLFDRQVVRARDGHLLCKVDDLELDEDADGRLYVTAILTGPLALGPRIGGVIGRLMTGTTQLFRMEEEPGPQRILMSGVSEIGSAVKVGGEVPEASLERWVRDHIIDPLPGSGTYQPAAREPRPIHLRNMPDRLQLSTLIGRKVVDVQGTMVGEVADVQLRQDGPLLEQAQQAFRLSGLIIIPRRTGQLFGYERGPGGKSPALVRMLIRRLHRGSRFAPWEQIDELSDPVRLSAPVGAMTPLTELFEISGR
jgi:sporulation protein YlmC with PRC-barrel domain